MERRTSTRLSAMERTQAKNNKRLDDIINMVQCVLSSVFKGKANGEKGLDDRRMPFVGERKSVTDERASVDRALHLGEGSSEQWWDNLTKSSDDEVDVMEVQY